LIFMIKDEIFSYAKRVKMKYGMDT